MNVGFEAVLSGLAVRQAAVGRLPALFVGHGSPMHAIEVSEFSRSWRRLGAVLPRPRAIVCVSAHWVTRGTRVLAAVRPRTIHDFGGFDARLFEQVYAAPGAPDVAERVRVLAAAAGFEVALDESWGLDHGAWAVLLHLFADADVPVIQLSLDVMKSAAEHVALARALAPLRDEGVLFLGSGNVVHNLQRVVWDVQAPAFDWAVAFDARFAAAVQAGDVADVVGFEAWEGVRLAHPTTEHFLPALYALGVWSPESESVGFFNDGLELGNLSMRSMVLG